jgi:hypothetical protein
MHKDNIHVIPHTDPRTGISDGSWFFLARDGGDKEIMPPGTPIYVAVMGDDGKYTLEVQHTNEPKTRGEIQGINNGGVQQVTAQQKESSEEKLKRIEKETALQESKTAGVNAGTAAVRARTEQVEAGTERLEAQQKAAPPANDPHTAVLGEAIAKGILTEDQISNFTKGQKGAVQTYLAEHHPNLDQKSVFMTGDERRRVDLANNAIHNLDDIATRLQRRPDLLGVVQGRVTQGKTLAGTNDRDLADIDAALDNYALAATGAHGIRAVQARTSAKEALLNGFKNGPQGVQAAMQAARGSLSNLAMAGKPRGLDGNPYVYKEQPQAQAAPQGIVAPPPGATHTAKGSDGKMHYTDNTGKDLGVVQ